MNIGDDEDNSSLYVDNIRLAGVHDVTTLQTVTGNVIADPNLDTNGPDPFGAVDQPGADGLGSVRRIEWRTALAYDVVIEVEAIESVRHERLRARSRGHLRGEGIWLLRPEGRSTDVTYLWRVELSRPWMRALAPLLAPAFRWNHDRVMRAGCIGLSRHLGVSPGVATSR